jgi:DNA-binding Lrp family transcriptional regulator
MLTEKEKQIIRELQRGIPLVSRPFKLLAQNLNTTEENLLDKIKYLLEHGYIRRFGATVRHYNLGYQANAMVVWNVPDELTEETGQIMAGFKEVSHCYQRPRRPGWPYNLFTVVHGRSREKCVQVVKKISLATGMKNYRLLFSTMELKKSSMRYFE